MIISSSNINKVQRNHSERAEATIS